MLCSAIAVCSPSCKKDEDTSQEQEFPQYIVFGRFITPGCFGNETCVEIFRLDASTLREDVNDQTPAQSDVYDGNYATQLSKEDQTSIEQMLRSDIPATLLSKPNGFVGTSPSWNTTYYYFEYRTESKHGHWVIDGSFDGNLGQELTTFINLLNSAVNTASF